MALNTLTELISEASKLHSQASQATWVRHQSIHASSNNSIRSMKNFVPGCEHPTWLAFSATESGIKFMISSDGTDSRGVAGIIVQALHGLNVAEIRSVDFSEFREIARYLNNRQQRTLNAILNTIKDTIR